MNTHHYSKPNSETWTGRQSDSKLYFHEKIECIDLDNLQQETKPNITFALLGYACDEGVKRNQGRVGAVNGPDAIRKMLAPISNHLSEETRVLDTGTILCPDNDLESTQSITTESICKLLQHNLFPIVIGGGHDLAYAHFNGIHKAFPDQKIGIINLDAHFDLRQVETVGNSGTPFYQIAKEQGNIEYLCLGIQKAANNRELFNTANQLGVHYLENTDFTMKNWETVSSKITSFIKNVDHIYITIDLDGFSSAYAPGVSAPSALGFDPDVAFNTLQLIYDSGKLKSLDIVELNPTYDLDNSTSRLAARIIYDVIEKLSIS